MKCLRERSNISVPAGTTRAYRNAVPVQKYLRKRRSHTFPHDYTPGRVEFERCQLKCKSIPEKIDPLHALSG